MQDPESTQKADNNKECPGRNKTQRHRRTTLTQEQLKTIRSLREMQFSIRAIAARLGLGCNVVRVTLARLSRIKSTTSLPSNT